MNEYYFPIDRRSQEPVFRQIVSHLQGLIMSGRLEAGTRLPPSRALANLLKVNRATVTAAYDALASLGCIEATVGNGTFVRHRPQNGDATGGNGDAGVAGDGTPYGRRFVQFSRGVDLLTRYPRRERVSTDHPDPVDFATLFPDE